MIQVRKPERVPAVLRRTGATKTAKLCVAFDASAREYRGGAKTFRFDSSTYAAKTVKRALRRAQHDKCCFCESKVSHISYGDVEHFRPKAGYRQSPGDDLGRPGYYWLAYEWENLFFACQICNQRFKQNLFPLLDPARRACSHHEVLDDERPVFISPAEKGIEHLIGFRQEYPYAKGGNRRARETVKHLGLDREELNEVRRDRLQKLELLSKNRQLLERRFPDARRPEDVQAHVNELTLELELAQADTAEYAAMARAALAVA